VPKYEALARPLISAQEPYGSIGFAASQGIETPKTEARG
jgi:hypothetical protein